MFRELLLMNNTGEYIEGTATGSFEMQINGPAGTQYTITPDAGGKWRWDKPADIAITKLFSMFKDQSAVTSIDKWTVDTSTVTNMARMFNNCPNLAAIDLSNFNTSNVTDMSFMFSGCRVLTALDVAGFDLSKSNNTSYMFRNCSSLTDLDMKNVNARVNYNMAHMFEGCTKLRTLDLSNFLSFDSSLNYNTYYLTGGCSFNELIIPNFYLYNMSNTVSEMFGNKCPADEILLGDAGVSDNFTQDVLAVCREYRPLADGYYWDAFESSYRGTVVGIRSSM